MSGLFLLYSFDFKNSINDIIKTSSSRCSEDAKMPLSFFIDNYWKENPSFDEKFIKNCLRNICLYILSLDIDENYNLCIKQNIIDIPKEIYKIIESNGQPMHLYDIFARIKAKYPNCKYLEPEQLRPIIINSPQSSGSEDELSLYRWYFNVLRGSVSITEEQKNIFDKEMSLRQEYFFTGQEFNFMKKCNDFKLYVNENYDMPNYINEPQLYTWFNKNKNIFQNFKDKRKRLFQDLLFSLFDFS